MLEAHPWLTLFVIIGLFFALCVYSDAYSDSIRIGVICIVVIWGGWRITIPDTTEQTAVQQQQTLKKEEEAKLKEIPRQLSKADGCTVYVFERKGREHFFTRCSKDTTTETTWTETCGKSCRRQISDPITTINSKD